MTQSTSDLLAGWILMMMTCVCSGVCVCVCVCLCMRVCVCNCIGAPCVQGITLHIIPLFFLRHWHNIQYTCMYSSLYVCVCVCVWLCVHRCWFIKKLSADEGSSYQARKKKKNKSRLFTIPQCIHSTVMMYGFLPSTHKEHHGICIYGKKDCRTL